MGLFTVLHDGDQDSRVTALQRWPAPLVEDLQNSCRVTSARLIGIDQLIARGFVVWTGRESPAKYILTCEAQQILAERGVGLSGG